jgi:hypothetical protein
MEARKKNHMIISIVAEKFTEKISTSLHDKSLDRSQVPVAHACNPRYSGGRDQLEISPGK